MKKFIALVLVLIMILSVAAFALAADPCNHNNWHTANTSSKTTKQTITYRNGCIHLSNPHTHWRYKTVTTTTYVCFTCGKTKESKSTSYGVEHCPKH